jgi:hypothetical protein
MTEPRRTRPPHDIMVQRAEAEFEIPVINLQNTFDLSNLEMIRILANAQIRFIGYMLRNEYTGNPEVPGGIRSAPDQEAGETK